MPLAPRILVISDEQWPRALLRAQLDEAGYDAVGVETIAAALDQPIEDPNRGPVRLVLVDSGFVAVEIEALEEARKRFTDIPFVVVHQAGAIPPGRWAATLQRPVAIGDVVEMVRRLVPVP